MTLVKEDLAANLKKYRKQSGKTIDDVGLLIGKSGKTVSAWEHGRGQPDADMLIKLCSIYKVRSVSDLLGRPSGHAGSSENDDSPGAYSDDPEERAILIRFHQLNADGKVKALAYLDDLLKIDSYREHTIVVKSVEIHEAKK